jgi:hypothetical protein
MTTQPPVPASGPIVFAYDGSELAKLAIDEAGRQLPPGRDALVLTVWQPFDVGFVPVGGFRFARPRSTTYARRPSRPPPKAPLWPRLPGSGRGAWRSKQRQAGRQSSTSPTTATQASSCSALTAAPG